MKDKRVTVLFLGSVGFPHGSAIVQRQIQLANSIMEYGINCVVLNKRSNHSKFISRKENISISGSYYGIKYFYSSLIAYKHSNFIIRNLFKTIGRIIEIFSIVYYRLFKNAKYILLRTNKLNNLKFYYFFSKMFNMKLIYDYVEYYDSIGKRNSTDLSSLANGFDNNFYKYLDKLIVISDFLGKHVEKISPRKKFIKIPPTIDLSLFDSVEVKMSKSFVFCGSAGYMDIIVFIIEAFKNSIAIDQNYGLKLIVNGSNEERDNIRKFIIDQNLNSYIELTSNLSYSDLIKNYKSATALLIPLNDNYQDQARFPFKICEYLASNRPIITSNTGAIKEYFTDNIDTIIAKTDDIDDFSSKLNFVIENPIKVELIGANGYKLGKRIFNYKSYSKSLGDFISN